MENTKIIQYSVFAGIIVLCILGIVNFFKTSDDLKQSRKIIDNVLIEVKESKALIQSQASTIDDLKKLNKQLANKVSQVDSTNTIIRKSLDDNFYHANKTISDIKKTVDNIEDITIH